MRMTVNTNSPRATRLVGIIFSLVGLGALAGTIFFARKQLDILNRWPVVDAEVVRSEVTTGRDSDGDTMYGAEVEFRFQYNGSEQTAVADRGWRTSSRNSMRRLTEKFAAGTRHPIRVNPEDPGDIRFNAAYSFEFFGVPLFMSGFAIVFLLIGIAVLRKRDAPYAQVSQAAQSQQAGACPTCGNIASITEKFCPKCGTMLRED